MIFDVAVGVNQQQLDQCCLDFFTSIPGLFKGAGADPSYPDINMNWQAMLPPLFNLQPDNSKPGDFNVNLPDLQVILTQSDGESTQFNLNVTLSCAIATVNNMLQLNVNDAGYAPLTDPIENYFVNKFVIPQLLNITSQMLAGLSIPSPNMPGIPLSPIAGTIADGSVIVVANLISNGPADIPTGYAWPADKFFAMISNAALQLVTDTTLSTKNILGSGEVGTDLGGAAYNYSINLLNPTIHLNGDYIQMNFNIDGMVEAKVKFLGISVGVKYKVYGGPSPEAIAKLQPEGNNSMNIVVQSINAFTFLLEPTGSVVDKIISAITWPITQAIVAVATPIATLFIKNINISTYELPGYTLNIENKVVQFTPQIGNVNLRQGTECMSGYLKTIIT